jgi:hypothetical protein
MNERATILWENGEYIAGAFRNNLYKLYDFYVEVSINDTGIMDIAAFKQGERLNKYLDQIKLNSLY